MKMRARISLSLMGSCVVLNAEHDTPIRDDQWRGALAEVLAPFQKSDIEAQLGFDHARVAVMTVDRPGGLTSLPAAKQASFVQAWATDMLRVTPDEQVIRWRALADPRKVLVSCVRRQIVEDLELACKDTGVQLASCRPAVMAAMESVKVVSSKHVTIVWTEGPPTAQRHSAVQLLRFHDERLQRSWRGWVPSDEDIDAVVTRFDASEEVTPAARVNLHWPTAASA
jgi:hypothetical protein